MGRGGTGLGFANAREEEQKQREQAATAAAAHVDGCWIQTDDLCTSIVGDSSSSAAGSS